ncbi:MAG TPA: helix-turn-helix domain-containing protein [Nitrolancea sp.]
MLDDNLDSRAYDLDAFSELDDGDLEEWDSLKDLLSALDDREREPIAPGSFDIPALLGDGDGITRWVLRLNQIRRLSGIALLQQGLPRAPWCIAVRVIAIDPDAIRIGVTTTRRVSQDQLSDFVAHLLGSTGDLNVEIEPVVRQATGERWLTIDEVADEFRARPRHIERWIEAGLLVARQVETAHGSEWRIRLRPAPTRQTVEV